MENLPNYCGPRSRLAAPSLPLRNLWDCWRIQRGFLEVRTDGKVLAVLGPGCLVLAAGGSASSPVELWTSRDYNACGLTPADDPLLPILETLGAYARWSALRLNLEKEHRLLAVLGELAGASRSLRITVTTLAAYCGYSRVWTIQMIDQLARRRLLRRDRTLLELLEEKKEDGELGVVRRPRHVVADATGGESDLQDSTYSVRGCPRQQDFVT